MELSNGISSHDTFNRVFSAIDCTEFESGFIKWVNRLTKVTNSEVLAIDDKMIRGAKSGGKKSPFHTVTAWANESNLVLGQVKTDEKSNKITAILKILEILTNEGSIITMMQ